MTTDQSKDRFTRLQEKLAKLPDCSPAERDAFAAERKAMEGTWLETITMMESGELQVRTWQYLPGGVQAEGNTESAPGDPDYDDFIQRHGALKPGESHTLAYKLIDERWIQVNEGDAAKTA